MLLKENASVEKLSGRYFTPQPIADFISRWVLDQGTRVRTILEPSAGEGVFLNSVSRINQARNASVVSIEIDEETARKAVNNKNYNWYETWESFNNENNKPPKAVINDDFYAAYKNGLGQKRFQAILGNPPYIRYQYLKEEQRNEQSEILTSNFMKSNKLINAWVSFTVACVSCMDSTSRIGFVIPAELLQVKYSEDLRKFLVGQLNRCTIITFDNLVFEDIEQEVVLLLGEKIANDEEHLIRIVSFSDADALDMDVVNAEEFIEADLHSGKWTKYFLDGDQLNLIARIKRDRRFVKFSDIAKCEVGITTGNNKYFCINVETVKKYHLQKYCRPLIARSVNIHGVQFLNEDWQENIDSGARTYLLDLTPFDSKKFTKGLLDYIKWGEENDYNTSYKTQIRDEWYKVPSVWSPDIFFLRRNYQFPKVMLNTDDVNAVSTDTMHRVKLKRHENGKRLIVSYYNTLGLLFSELEGRSYGGGVLEILPGEVGNIILTNIFSEEVISNREVDALFQRIDSFIRQNGSDNIEQLLDETDRRILIDVAGLSRDEVGILRSAWKRLKN
nr:class I SAM-dependent methyltransferase [Lachnospiraceae bacterium]